MASTWIRVDEDTAALLREMANERAVSIGVVVADLLEEDRKRRFWAAVDADFIAMRTDPQAWSEERVIRDELAGTLMDGLTDALDG